MDFVCEVQVLKSSTVLAVIQGSLDAGTSIQAENDLSKYLGNPQIKNYILDLSTLTFISSSGLRILMIIVKAVMPRNGKLFLVGAGEQVINLMKMSGMTKMVYLRNSVAECETT